MNRIRVLLERAPLILTLTGDDTRDGHGNPEAGPQQTADLPAS